MTPTQSPSRNKNAAAPLAIQLTNVTVYLDDRLVLDDISMEIQDGHFVGIIGPNGAGKTTLLRVITGLIKPRKGAVKLFGSSELTDRHLIGYVPQKITVDWHFPVSVYDVVMMGRYGKMGLFKRPAKVDRDRVWQALERVQMTDYAKQQFGALSGGQQQRVFIARALSAEPRLLILDEPTSGIDRTSRDSFYNLIRELNDELHLTILFVTHEIEVVPRLVDEIVCVNQRLHLHDKPENIMDADHFKELYGCESEFLLHGHVPHRVLPLHNHESHGAHDAD